MTNDTSNNLNKNSSHLHSLLVIADPDCNGRGPQSSTKSGKFMIVCICNNVSDRKIRQAVDAGMTTMSQMRERLDVGTCCGKCNSCAKTILRERLEQANQAQPMFFQVVVSA